MANTNHQRQRRLRRWRHWQRLPLPPLHRDACGAEQGVPGLIVVFFLNYAHPPLGVGQLVGLSRLAEKQMIRWGEDT